MTSIFNFKRDRLNGLDHLRALAIILVMIFHYNRGIPSWLEPIQKIGWSGVDLFFVLSGYLIGFQLLREMKNTNSISFKRFYFKRFFRIIPPYIVVLILYYAFQNHIEGSGLPPVWKFLTFTQNIGLDVVHNKSFSHAWSLCIEEQFYLLLPIFILIIFLLKFQNRGVYLLLALVVVGFIFRLYNWYTYVQPFVDNGKDQEMMLGFLEKIYYPTYNRMDGLIIGVSIATIFSYQTKFTNMLVTHGNLLLSIGIGLLIVAFNVCGTLISYNTAIYGFPLVSVAYGFIVIAALSNSCILCKVKSKFTYIIATLSYAVYLIHKELFYLIKLGVKQFGFDSNNAWIFCICLIASFILGLILHIVIEKPSSRLRDKVLDYEKFNARPIEAYNTIITTYKRFSKSN